MTRAPVLIAVGAALAIATLTLIGIVLPAEYGIDPLGSGRALGLTDLGERSQQQHGGRVWPGTGNHREQRAAFELAPFESVEHSYRMMAGDTIVFSWRADGAVVFNLHGVPDGAPAPVAGPPQPPH